MSIGIYCTVKSEELRLALATLKYASLSNHVEHIVILLTDRKSKPPKKLSSKITLYSYNFGSGYDSPIPDGGYDQIAARNFLIEKLAETDADWLLMHDADDFYSLDYYDFISTECDAFDAVTCSCFSIRKGPEICIPKDKTRYIQGKNLYDPHTRIWKKKLNLRYEKSIGIEKFFLNHSRHCGVVFPNGINILSTTGVYHFHLHALLKKRHSEKISSYSHQCMPIPESVEHFLKENNVLFHNNRKIPQCMNK